MGRSGDHASVIRAALVDVVGSVVTNRVANDVQLLKNATLLRKASVEDATAEGRGAP
jgi:hypothetical protein